MNALRITEAYHYTIGMFAGWRNEPSAIVVLKNRHAKVAGSTQVLKSQAVAIERLREGIGPENLLAAVMKMRDFIEASEDSEHYSQGPTLVADLSRAPFDTYEPILKSFNRSTVFVALTQGEQSHDHGKRKHWSRRDVLGKLGHGIDLDKIEFDRTHRHTKDLLQQAEAATKKEPKIDASGLSESEGEEIVRALGVAYYQATLKPQIIDPANIPVAPSMGETRRARHAREARPSSLGTGSRSARHAANRR